MGQDINMHESAQQVGHHLGMGKQEFVTVVVVHSASITVGGAFGNELCR